MLRALADYRARHGLTSWEETVQALLARSSDGVVLVNLEQVREIADAVLYEGYLLYPYRASSGKNQSRWQFGVLGPPRASAASFSEDPGMAMQCLLRPAGAGRQPSPSTCGSCNCRCARPSGSTPTAATSRSESLDVDGSAVLSWDEAVEREISLPDVRLDQQAEYPLEFPGGEDIEPVTDAAGVLVGRIVRRRWPLTARLQVSTEVDDGFYRLSVQVDNTAPSRSAGKDAAIRVSLIGAHLVLQAHGAEFVSLLEPPDEAARPPSAAGSGAASRCWPGPPGSTDVLLGAPIILYDYPEIARAEQGRAVRLDRDRRDPHAAGHDDDRAGEGRSPGHRPAGPGDHRPVRRHVGGGSAAAARHSARSVPPAGPAPRRRRLDRSARPARAARASTPATCRGGTRRPTRACSPRWMPC